MKVKLRKFFIGSFLLSMMFLLAFGYGNQRDRGIVSPAEVVLSVPGMHCVACPTIVKKSLESVRGVIGVEISGVNKTAMVKYDSAQVTVNMLIKATTMVGYPSTIKKGLNTDAQSVAKVILDIPNMHCVACPTIVRKSLEGLVGILEVKVSGANKTATVLYNASQLHIPTLIKATTMVGYPSTVRKKEQSQSVIKKVTLAVPRGVFNSHRHCKQYLY